MDRKYVIYEFTGEIPVKVSLSDEWEVYDNLVIDGSDPRELEEFDSLEEAKKCFEAKYKSLGWIRRTQGFSGVKFYQTEIYTLTELIDDGMTENVIDICMVSKSDREECFKCNC